MAIKLGNKVRLKDITEKESWFMCLDPSIWGKYKNNIFTVVQRPHYKSAPPKHQDITGNIIYITTQHRQGGELCWWVYDRFVTPVQRQLTFVFED
jgi:hypothetical protein